MIFITKYKCSQCLEQLKDIKVQEEDGVGLWSLHCQNPYCPNFGLMQVPEEIIDREKQLNEKN